MRAGVFALLAMCACGRVGFDDGEALVDPPGDPPAKLPTTDRHWVDRGLTAPGGLVGPRAVYDRAHNAVILYGGDRKTGFPPVEPSAAMWKYDGAAWTLLCDPCAPGPRYAPAMAYDPKRARIVMYGGYGGGQVLGDLWEWDGAWHPIAAQGEAPGERVFAQMAYDERRRTMVLFGGCHSPDSYEDKVFELVDDTWRNATVAGGPPMIGGLGTTATWNADSQTIDVLEDHGTTGDVDAIWSWNGAAWQLRCAGCTGTPRRDASLVFDPSPPRLYELGGYSGADATELSGTWVRDGNGTRLASPLVKQRDSVAIAYDERRDVFVLYGGNGDACKGGENCDETWELVRD